MGWWQYKYNCDGFPKWFNLFFSSCVIRTWKQKITCTFYVLITMKLWLGLCKGLKLTVYNSKRYWMLKGSFILNVLLDFGYERDVIWLKLWLRSPEFI